MLAFIQTNNLLGKRARSPQRKASNQNTLAMYIPTFLVDLGSSLCSQVLHRHHAGRRLEARGMLLNLPSRFLLLCSIRVQCVQSLLVNVSQFCAGCAVSQASQTGASAGLDSECSSQSTNRKS